MRTLLSKKVPHHKLAVCGRFGALHLRVRLELAEGWTLLFGPSGSGKSTLLKAACGLVHGENISFERLVNDTCWLVLQDARHSLPPHLRRIRWAPQNASLFPNISVRSNASFGMDVTGKSMHSHQALVDEALGLFDLHSLASRLPRDLSGGERQRVNLARAFAAPDCGLMLLDEPFAGIDKALRDQLLPRMRDWALQRNFPVLSVSHDVEEALQIADEVVVLRDGKITRQGEASTVLVEERMRMLRSLSNIKPTED